MQDNDELPIMEYDPTKTLPLKNFFLDGDDSEEDDRDEDVKEEEKNPIDELFSS